MRTKALARKRVEQIAYVLSKTGVWMPNLKRAVKRGKPKVNWKEVALLTREPPSYHTHVGLITCSYDHAGVNNRGKTVVFWNLDVPYYGRRYRRQFMYGLERGRPKQWHVFEPKWL